MIKLLRVHGSENSFILLDQEQLEIPMNPDQLVQLAIQVTSNQTGLLGGADGLLVVSSSDHAGVRGRMQVINNDGSFASMCGNGLRTVARYLAEKYEENDFLVQTDQADLHVGRVATIGNGLPTYQVEISPVSFNAKNLPMQIENQDKLFNAPVRDFDDQLLFSAVAVPNPHLIAIDNNNRLLTKKLAELGHRLNASNPWFPKGVNVSFGRVIGQNQLFVQTYERGVGFTNACGTGMSATSLVWSLLNDGQTRLGEVNDIFNPGGMVKTRVNQIHGAYTIDLIGNATFTHQIWIDEDQLRQNNLEQVQIESTGEELHYQEFIRQLPRYRF